MAALASALVALAPVATAAARGGVYGGITKAGDPIVLKSDAKGSKLTGAVFRVRVDGDDEWWPIAGQVKVVASKGSHTIPTGVLRTTRNAKGRFSAQLLGTLSSSADPVVMGGITLTGSMTAKTAKGTIKAWITVTEHGQLADNYSTPSIKWTAERAAGRVYGGALMNHEPIVIRLNQRRTMVAGLGLVCDTEDSTPPGWFWSSSEWLSDFPLSQGHFGDKFSVTQPLSDGTALTYQWDVAGRVTAAKASGLISLTVNGQQPSGEALSFTMQPTMFTATSG